jgi:hypothetical protein
LPITFDRTCAIRSASQTRLEAQIDGMVSILLLSEDRKHLCYGAAPSLPDRYRLAADGVAIGPRAGSSGTAAFFKPE